MTPVPIVLNLPARPEPEGEQLSEITFTDMEVFSADNKCACAASDSNPY